MANFRRLVRNEALTNLSKENYQGQGRILKSNEFKEALYSLFLHTLDNSERCGKDKLKTMYADMLEQLKALMAHSGVSAKDVKLNINQPLKWYASFDSEQVRFERAKTNLINRLNELKNIQSQEVLKDQFNDVFNAFNDYIEVSNQKLSEVEKRRIEIKSQLGDYSKGIYLEEVVKVQRHTI